MRFNFDRRKGQVFTTFYDGARTNICYNALDRHIEQGRGGQPCFLWEVIVCWIYALRRHDVVQSSIQQYAKLFHHLRIYILQLPSCT